MVKREPFQWRMSITAPLAANDISNRHQERNPRYQKFVNMMFSLILLISALAIACIVYWLRKELFSFLFAPSKPKLYVERPVMTENELEFYGQLRDALPSDLHICPQVSMAAVMTTRSGLTQSEQFSARNKFDRKIIDFVVLDAKGRTIALVELDDKSHRAKRDSERDNLTALAGLRTVRFPSRPRPSNKAIIDAVILPPPSTAIKLQ